MKKNQNVGTKSTFTPKKISLSIPTFLIISLKNFENFVILFHIVITNLSPSTAAYIIFFLFKYQNVFYSNFQCYPENKTSILTILIYYSSLSSS